MVCIIATYPLKTSPYLQKYMDLLSEWKVPFDYITREKTEQGVNQHQGNHIIEYYEGVCSRKEHIKYLIKRRRFIKKIITEKKYDRLIFLSSVPAYLIWIHLLRKYKGKYMIDIRDYINVKYPFFWSIFNHLIKKSALTTISSRGFLTWLKNSEKIRVVHNLPNTGGINEKKPVFEKTPLIIGYLGGIGYFEQNKGMVEKLKNSKKYTLLYQGIYPKRYNIRDYCQENEISNVIFKGEYNNTEKSEIYKSVDLINAIYANDSLVVTTALPNKLYDCLYYKIPIIVCSGTYLAEVVETYHLGIAIDATVDDVEKKLNDYIHSFDGDKFLIGCKDYLELVVREQKQTEIEIMRFIVGKRVVELI